MENKFPNTCRTCYEYESDNNLISLYETEQKENTMYKDMLRDCTAIEIFADDNLPSVICQQCVTILITAFKFKRDCCLNDQKFKTALEKKRSTNSNSADVTNTIFTILEAGQDNSSQDTSDYDKNKSETHNMVTNHYSDNDGIEIKETKRHLCNNYSGMVGSENAMLEHEVLKKQNVTISSEKDLNVHTESQQFMCNHCNVSFPQSLALIRHVQNNHNLQKLPKAKKDVEGRHVCTYCGKSFRSTYDLTVHVRRHTGIKPYVCKICNMSFVSMGRLTSHSRMHTGETPFTCKICDKAFSHSSTLYRHVQSHKKQHVCDFCQKRFTFLSGLETHKRMHSGVKPHQCKTCGKGFTENKLLVRHLVVHEEDKPHLCNVCGKNFKRIATLNKHLKTQHGVRKKLENFVDDRAV